MLFRTFGPELRLFLARYVGSPAVAEDLVQDLFLAIWDRRDTVRVRGSVRTYLFAAARNRALNHLKRERIADNFRLGLTGRLDTLERLLREDDERKTASPKPHGDDR